jgi:hypothetical protein
VTIDGHYKFFRRRVACRNVWCSVCSAQRLAIGTRHLAVYHLFFVPLMPLGRAVEWRCNTCFIRVDAFRPVRPWISGFGMLAGLFFVLFGAAGFLPAPTDVRRPVDLGFSFEMIGLGMVMVGFFAWLRHRRRRHEEAVRQVVPLVGDRCPLCAAALAPAARPYCAACEVDVLTR